MTMKGAVAIENSLKRTAVQTAIRFSSVMSGGRLIWSVGLPSNFVRFERYEATTLGSGIAFTPVEAGGHKFCRSQGNVKHHHTTYGREPARALGLRVPLAPSTIFAAAVHDPRTGRFIIHNLPAELRLAGTIHAKEEKVEQAQPVPFVPKKIEVTSESPRCESHSKPVVAASRPQGVDLKSALSLVNELMREAEAEPFIENGQVRARVSVTL